MLQLQKRGLVQQPQPLRNLHLEHGHPPQRRQPVPPLRHQLDGARLARLAVHPEVLAVVVNPAHFPLPFRIRDVGLLQAGRADHRPLQPARWVVVPVDDLIRPVVHQIGSRSSRSVLFRPRQRSGGAARANPRKVHHDEAAAAYHGLDEPLAEELAEGGSLQIAIVRQRRVEALGRGVASFHQQHRLTPHQRRRIPVDNRPDVVLVEHAAEPFLVDFARLLVPAHQVFRGGRAQLLAARVEVFVLLPHRLARDVLGMFPVDVLHGKIRSPCSPTVLAGMHSCQSRYPSASDRCVLSRSRSLSIW